jgi:hypothetical protein
MRSAAAPFDWPAMISGPATFYDGVVSARRSVTVELMPDAIDIRGPDGCMLAQWRFGEIAPLPAAEGVLRLGRVRGETAARLEIHDEAVAAALLKSIGPADRSGLTNSRTRHRVVLYSTLAIASAVGGAVWGMPPLAEKLASQLPVTLEMRIGAAIDAQVRQALGGNRGNRSFECGTRGAGPATPRGELDKLVGTLEATADLPLPVNVAVARRPEVNAITLPGGRIYVFSSLIDGATSADELAGVIGHEMGHVAHRDGTKALLRTAGLSFLFGMLLGDFTGGGAVVVAARIVLQSAYSRDAEADADAYGANLMLKLGRDPRALGTFLKRVAGNAGAAPHFLLSHPAAEERAAAIERIAQSTPGAGSPGAPLLTPAEWTRVRCICDGRVAGATSYPGGRADGT